MAEKHEIDTFFNPKSVAIIGATDRPGTWGYFVMMGLTGGKLPGSDSEPVARFNGEIYPINNRSEKIFGLKAYKDIRDVPGPVDAAVVSIPESTVEDVIKACGEKGVKGVTIITAGFSESAAGGKKREEEMKRIAHSYGMRIVGPNVGGAFNLHAHYNTTVVESDLRGSRRLVPTPLSAVCQGGYAIFDLVISSFERKMGFGKFIQSGNECDLQVVDFLEYYGNDPETKGIVMYLESLRNIPKFREVAAEVTRKKPIIVFKAGRTENGTRAAHSHTGALAGSDAMFQGLFNQLNIVVSPSMEMLIPLSHSILELPPMKGNRVAIMTYGGSWGVPLTDHLELEGMRVPEFSPDLQKKLREHMPERASVRNPIDLGAAGMASLPTELLMTLGRTVLSSGEVDAMVLHGLGAPLMPGDNPNLGLMKMYADFEKFMMKSVSSLQDEFSMPVLLGSHFNKYESQAIHDVYEEKLRVYIRLEEISQTLSRLYKYWRRKGKV